MRGLWLESGTLELRGAIPVPAVMEGEAMVQVLRAGICATDLQLIAGYYPFTGVLGHEFVGRVVDGPDPLRGRRVVGEINASCGSCVHCAAGRPRHCSERTVLGIVGRHGAFADYLALPAANLHPVPDTLTDDAAIFVEPLAAALRIREQVELGPDDRVLIVGDGKLAQLVARGLAPSGCQLTVLGRHARKLALLRHLELEAVLEAPNRLFDVAVDCTGNAGGFAIARAALRPQGKLVLKSTYAGDLTVDASAIAVDEIEIIGSRCGPFGPAIDMLAAGLDVAPLIEARYVLGDAIAAFEHAGRRGALKVLVDID